MNRIPITKPYFDNDEERQAALTIRSGWIMQGPKVEEFEEAVRCFVGSRYAIAVSSGTSALHLSMLAAGIGSQDEVIVPSFSFIATANTVCHVGAKPVFVDIDINTCNLNVNEIERCITSKTKAIVAVHQFGLPCDMDEIGKIAERHQLLIIEDAACALGSEYKASRIGNISPLTCFSFHPRKIVTTGEGGMITTNDEALAEKLRLLRNHGMSIPGYDRHSSTSSVQEAYLDYGYNCRMTDIHAAIGVVQMNKIDAVIEKRKKIASRYDNGFAKMENVMVTVVPEHIKTNYQSYILRFVSDVPNYCDIIIKELSEAGVASKRANMTIHKEPCYENEYGRLSLPVTEDIAKSSILLPIYPSMTIDEQDRVIQAMKRLLSG